MDFPWFFLWFDIPSLLWLKLSHGFCYGFSYGFSYTIYSHIPFPYSFLSTRETSQKKTSAAHLQEGTTIAELKFTVVLGTQQHCQLNSQKDGQTVENQENFLGETCPILDTFSFCMFFVNLFGYFFYDYSIG